MKIKLLLLVFLDLQISFFPMKNFVKINQTFILFIKHDNAQENNMMIIKRMTFIE